MKQLLLIVVTLVVATGNVHAESTDSTSAPKVALARRLYDEGIDALGKGQWSVAYDQRALHGTDHRLDLAAACGRWTVRTECSISGSPL